MYDIKNIWSLVTKIINTFIKPEKKQRKKIFKLEKGIFLQKETIL